MPMASQAQVVVPLPLFPVKHMFKRWLNEEAIAALLPLKGAMQKWNGMEGTVVELRRDDKVMFYRWGHKVHELTPRQSGGLPSPDELDFLLRKRSEGMNKTGHERSHVASMADKYPLAGFIVLDREVAIPRDALTDLSLTRHQVDLLLLEVATGKLWLVEVKLARGEDLDGDVIEQLVQTCALPAALKGGEDAFISHYARVLEQKTLLGLVGGSLPVPIGPTRTACVAVGDSKQAQGRIACWDQDIARLDHIVFGLCAKDAPPPTVAEMVPLPKAHAEAVKSPDRAIHAPRRSRHTPFALQEQRRQKAWERAHPGADRLGSLAPWINEYLSEHDTDPHSHLTHLRSSQAMCLQAFVQVARKPDGSAAAALLDLLGVSLHGFQPREIEAVHFEAPHGRDCLKGRSSCGCAADAREVVGEKGSKWTRLDVMLLLRGVQDRRQVRACVGIEFKYTEPEFGSCGGFVSKGFDDRGRRACVYDPEDREASCYLLIKEERKYLKDRSMFRLDPLVHGTPCALLGPMNQLYRGHSMTRALARHLGCELAFYGCVFHDTNDVLMLPERPLPGLPAEKLSPIERYPGLLNEQDAREFFCFSIQDLAQKWEKNPAVNKSAWMHMFRERYLTAQKG